MDLECTCKIIEKFKIPERKRLPSYLKISGCFKSFLTDFTSKFALAVNILSMAVHAARTPESFTTINTSVREFAGMLSHMNVQPVFVNKSFNINKYNLKKKKVKFKIERFKIEFTRRCSADIGVVSCSGASLNVG